MNVESAIAFKIVKEYFLHILPQSILTHLNDYFFESHRVLRKKNYLEKYYNKIRVIPEKIRLFSSSLSIENLNLLYKAVLEEKKIKIIYKEQTHSEAITQIYTVNPIGIIFKESKIHLIAFYKTLKKSAHLREFVIQRIEKVIILNQPILSKTLDSFSLDQYLLAKNKEQEDIELTLLTNQKLKLVLEQTPLEEE
jgi:hypothetical protein